MEKLISYFEFNCNDGVVWVTPIKLLGKLISLNKLVASDMRATLYEVGDPSTML